jgi:hypothetical protein
MRRENTGGPFTHHTESFISHGYMFRVYVCFRVDGNSTDAHLFRCAHYTTGDFSPVGNEDLVEKLWQQVRSVSASAGPPVAVQLLHEKDALATVYPTLGSVHETLEKEKKVDGTSLAAKDQRENGEEW